MQMQTHQSNNVGDSGLEASVDEDSHHTLHPISGCKESMVQVILEHYNHLKSEASSSKTNSFGTSWIVMHYLGEELWVGEEKWKMVLDKHFHGHSSLCTDHHALRSRKRRKCRYQLKINHLDSSNAPPPLALYIQAFPDNISSLSDEFTAEVCSSSCQGVLSQIRWAQTRLQTKNDW